MLYDSSSSGSYRSDFAAEPNENNPQVPMLNLCLSKKPDVAIPKIPLVNSKGQFENLKQQKQNKDFQDEFMEKINEFSESWREQIEREKRF